MGYRSDVALCLTAEAEQTLRSRLNKVQKTHSSGDVTALREFITSPQTFKEENGVTLRYWSWCKWYLEAPVISFMDNFMANLEYSSYLFCVSEMSWTTLSAMVDFMRIHLNSMCL